jgi:hypothetical protein
MPDHYKQIQVALEGSGFFTTLRPNSDGGFNLVCSSRRHGDGALGGTSFWLLCSFETNQWYIGTWLPCCYEIPSTVDIISLCVELLNVGDSAIATLPDEIVKRYSLTEVQDADTNGTS